MRRGFPRLLSLLLVTALLTGCWDYIEIEALEFVFGLGVDQVEPDYVVVVEMVKTSGGGQQVEVEPLVLATKGKSVSAAGRSLSNPAGLRAFWPHAYVFLMSEQVAREGIVPAMENIVRSRHIRSTVWVFITKDCTAEEVFKSKPPAANSVSEHLNAIALMQETISGFIPLQVWQLSQAFAAEGIAAILPTVKLVHEQGDLVPIVEGTAVFKGDRMVGWLDGHESDILCLLKGIIQRCYFVIDTKVGENEFFPITYELVGNRVEIKPQDKDGKLSVSIALDLHFSVEEMGRAPYSFRDEAFARSVQAQLATAFTHWIREFLSKTQQEYNADILGFGQLVRRKEPQVWRRLGENWDVHFRDLPVDLEVKCKVTMAGLSSEPLRVRE
ncbi:MAG: Ger(x)C family spore germination protein [Firmicutes bacterium]|jgi:spore germination protein KC|nr:Ger(x)C family spore germination protein [Bacillota bacterium]